MWFSLIDKVCSERALRASWEHVAASRGSGGVDRQTVEQYRAGVDARLRELSEDLGAGTYRPKPVRRVDMHEPGGFDFLGYHFELGVRTPRRKSPRGTWRS